MWIIQRTTTKTDQVSIKPKYIQLTTKNETLTHILHVDNSKQTTKTDQVSIKPKYIQITNKNETLTHVLYVDNSKQQQQKQIK